MKKDPRSPVPRDLPAWKLERLHLGEIDDPALRAAAAAELAELSRSDAEILAAHPPGQVAAEVQRRRHVEAVRASLKMEPRGLLMLIPAVAVAAMLALVLVPRQHPESGEPEEIVRVKGDPALRVYRQTSAGPEELKKGARAKPGDRLQLAVVSAGAPVGVVVSVDGRGAVTLHYPTTEEGSTALPAGETPLPSSYELDDAPSFERFFLVTGPTPVPVGKVLAAVRDLAATGRAADAPLALPASLRQWSLLIHKEAR